MGRKYIEKKRPGKVKKTILSVLWILLVLLLIAGAILGYRYRSHIKAAVIWLTTSQEDIQKNIDKAKDAQTEVLNSSGFNASKELDEALMTGKISAEEHTQILLGAVSLEQVLASKEELAQTPPEISDAADDSQITDESKTDDTQTDAEKDSESADESPKEPDLKDDKNDEGKNDKPSQPAEKPQDGKQEGAAKPAEPPKEQTPSANDADKRIAELVTKMYVLKADYTGAVEGVVASMKADFVKLPPEQRTTAAKQSIATGYMGQINAMEAQCDAQVNAIVSELRQILKDNGRDMSLADAIVSTYATEKENTKAYYLSTYGD